VICPEFHLPNGTTNPSFICEGCLSAEEDAAKEVAR